MLHDPFLCLSIIGAHIFHHGRNIVLRLLFLKLLCQHFGDAAIRHPQSYPMVGHTRFESMPIELTHSLGSESSRYLIFATLWAIPLEASVLGYSFFDTMPR